MKILVTGGSGFIGRSLLKALVAQGHTIHLLTRDPQSIPRRLSVPCQPFFWGPEQGFIAKEALVGIDAVIHLAGEPVAGGRWTTKQKQKIFDSRVMGTRHLMQSLREQGVKPQVVISASAIGFYGDRGDEPLTEDASVGNDFLAGVCQAWEAGLFAHKSEFPRLISMRMGIVFGMGGGALSKMLPPFKLGVGGPLGTGKQWMSWIHLKDLVALFLFVLEHARISGPVNAVSPNPVTNQEFSQTLASVLHRPCLMRTPGFALRLVLGEMADFLLTGQRVVPQKAVNCGFKFVYTELRPALEEILK